jgi:hypothetical protein
MMRRRMATRLPRPRLPRRRRVVLERERLAPRWRRARMRRLRMSRKAVMVLMSLLERLHLEWAELRVYS